MICDQCETVAHCMKHGCVPKQPMPTKDEALKLALEALLINCGGNTEGIGKEAIDACQQALAAPVQEPSVFGLLFAVEQAVKNGDCPWEIENAFDAYEIERMEKKNGYRQNYSHGKSMPTCEHKQS